MKKSYANANKWRRAAMQRASGIDADECRRRQEAADVHNRIQDACDSDLLTDQQLYIQGKMSLEEYQDYLLFKHSGH